MKIMFINSVIDYGSTGKIVRDLADGMKAAGHQVLIVFGRNSTSDQEDVFDISDKLGSFYHLLMTRIFDRHGLHSKKATIKLINKIKEFKPDVIHLHNLHGYYINYEILMKFLKEEKQIKIIWTLHDLWTIAGSVAHFSYYGCKLYDEGCVVANNARVYPKSLIFLREKKNFYNKKESFLGFTNLEIVTVSDWQKDMLESSFLNKYPITRIYNGLDFKKFNATYKIKKAENTILGTNTYWNKQKGFNDFLKLAKILPEKYKLILAGLNDKQISQLPDNITGLKLIRNQSELLKIYAESEIFLNLSVEETMGMTTVESLACGSPVVVYDQTAVPEIINESVGEVVKAGDIEALLKAIENVNERNISPKICYDFAYKNYNKEMMLKAYRELYLK